MQYRQPWWPTVHQIRADQIYLQLLTETEKGDNDEIPDAVFFSHFPLIWENAPYSFIKLSFYKKELI